jgi:hypothetical protein
MTGRHVIPVAGTIGLARLMRSACKDSSMKEDVLEQIVDDYLQMRGYFTTHNIRFNPPKDLDYVPRNDAVASDIDVVGLHPHHTGADRVMVVSCKSWQSGFDATHILAQLRRKAPNPKRLRELQFRELWLDKWARGFRKTITELTGETAFTYCLAVTRVKGDTAAWNADVTIRHNLGGNPLRFLTLEDMWAAVLSKVTTTPASSEIGRLAQLLKAAGLTAPAPITPPSGPQPGSAAAAEELANLDC